MIRTFTFLDESGLLMPPQSLKRGQRFYGIGTLKHKFPLNLIQPLHRVHEGLCNGLKKDDTRLEFSFKSTTASSIEYDLNFLGSLLEDSDWEFNCLYFDIDDGLYRKPNDAVESWDHYVQFSKMLIRNNLWTDEETVLIADYQKKPKASRKLFEYIATDVPQVHSVLQVESHGVLLIQVTDLLLGGYLYSLNSENADKEGNKTRLSKKVISIKEAVGKNRFNCWKVDWSRGSRRIGRV